jgi:Protein of unknown function (DUF3386)
MKRTLFSLFCLALLASGARAQTEQPPASAPTKADPAAWNLLKSTRATRQELPPNFAGASGEITLNDNGKVVTGKFAYEIGKRAEVEIEGLSDESKLWLNEQVASILTHRRSVDFAKGDGKNPITFGADDNSPAGRRVVLNDRMKSSYRVKNSQVSEVDRTIGREHFVITILETTPVAGGKFLPRHFTVNYFDARTGALKRAETFTDEYTKVSDIWFPVTRRAVRAENGAVITRVIEFRNSQIKLTGDQVSR